MVSSQQTSAYLIENNLFYYLRSPVLLAGSSGNVVGYNYFDTMHCDTCGSTWMPHQMSMHAAHVFMNLFEGNKFTSYVSDFWHGSASHNTLFRNEIIMNRDQPEYTSNVVAIKLEQWSRYVNVVGNVLGHDGVTGVYELDGVDTSAGVDSIYKLGYEISGDQNAAGNDPLVGATLFRHGNFDYITDSVIWDAGTPNHDLPDSLYLDGAPEFFGNYPWPNIGPDLAPMVGYLPAEDRFDGIERFRPGDADGDGLIDGSDLATWQVNYDPTGLNVNTFYMGDWDNNGVIDGADLAIWQTNYAPV